MSKKILFSGLFAFFVAAATATTFISSSGPACADGRCPACCTDNCSDCSGCKTEKSN